MVGAVARREDGLVGVASRGAGIGAVHGAGLHLRDRATKEPAAEEASALCERMLELGVIVQPTGELENVLKIKPPLCITQDDADRFTDTLDRVLGEGW